MQNGSLIYLENYSKKFQRELLNNVSLSLDKKIVGLVGSNGCGKSTLLNDLYEKNKSQVTYITQRFHLFEKLTGEDNLRIIFEDIVEELLETIGIKEVYQKKVTQLSSGERQRLLFYIALKAENDYIFLDEIDNHLDYENAKKFYELIRKTGKNYLIISHHQDLIFNYADKVYEIKDKKLLATIINEDNVATFETKKSQPLKLIKQFFKRTKYWFYLVFMVVLLILTSVFQSINLGFDVDEYYANRDNLIVEPIIYKDNKKYGCSFQNSIYLQLIRDQFEFVDVDLMSLLDYKCILLNNNPLTKSYVHAMFPNLDYSKDGIYLSNKDESIENKTFFSMPQRLFVLDNDRFEIEIEVEVPILGYVDIPKGSFVYHYDYLTKLYNMISFNGVCFIDKFYYDAFSCYKYFPKMRFFGVLKKHLDLSKGSNNIEVKDFTFVLHNDVIEKHSSDYMVYTMNKIVYDVSSYLFIVCSFLIGFYFNKYYLNSYKDTFTSYYHLYGVNSKEVGIILLARLILFVFAPIMLLITIF